MKSWKGEIEVSSRAIRGTRFEEEEEDRITIE